MKRPLFVSAIFFMLGIIFSQANYLFCIVIFFALFYIYFKHGIKTMLIFFTIFSCGLLRVQFSQNVLDLPSKNITIEGVVKNIAALKNYNRAMVKVNYLGKKFNVQAYFSDNNIFVGDKIILKGKFILPQPRRNPGGFNEKNYFRTKSIAYKIFPVSVKNCGQQNYFIYTLEKFKNNLGNVYDIIFQSKEAGILKAMIIGEKSEIDDYTSQLYKSAGIYHILAISGLHISIIALLVNYLLKFIFGKRNSCILCILILCLYCLMTGANVSTVRAVIMATVIIVGQLIYRESDLLTSLSFCSLLLMLFNPFCIFDIGFEYSFGAVFGIAVFTEPIDRGLMLIGLKFLAIKFFRANKFFAASIAASLITYLVNAYYFFYFTPYSIFINLFVLPSIALIVALGFIVGFIGLINLHLASFISAPILILLWFYEKLCEIFTLLPFSKILTGHVNLFFVSLYLMWLFLFISFLIGRPMKKYFYIFSSFFIFCIAIVFIIPKPTQITMLDVGEGDCFVINCGKVFVIDGGGKRTQDIGNNTGQNILIPFLDYKAKNFIDAVFISHSDADHITGIIELLESKRVGKIFLPQKFSDDELAQKLFAQAKKFSIPIEYLKAGDILSDKKFYFQCIYPFENTVANSNNDSSLVLKLHLPKTKILFTGDIEKDAEHEILSENISADILKLAHHGSKTSSTLEFLQKVNPTLALVSTGVNNYYSHPSDEVVQRLKDLNIELFDTAQCGAVTIKFLNDKIKISSELNFNEKIFFNKVK